MHTIPLEAFIEDALSWGAVEGAAERFIVRSSSQGHVIHLYLDPDDSHANLVSKDQVLDAIAAGLERGAAVTLGDVP